MQSEWVLDSTRTAMQKTQFIKRQNKLSNKLKFDLLGGVAVPHEDLDKTRTAIGKKHSF